MIIIITTFPLTSHILPNYLSSAECLWGCKLRRDQWRIQGGAPRPKFFLISCSFFLENLAKLYVEDAPPGFAPLLRGILDPPLVTVIISGGSRIYQWDANLLFSQIFLKTRTRFRVKYVCNGLRKAIPCSLHIRKWCPLAHLTTVGEI